jgi:hypothetical protein
LSGCEKARENLAIHQADKRAGNPSKRCATKRRAQTSGGVADKAGVLTVKQSATAQKKFNNKNPQGGSAAAVAVFIMGKSKWVVFA